MLLQRRLFANADSHYFRIRSSHSDLQDILAMPSILRLTKNSVGLERSRLAKSFITPEHVQKVDKTYFRLRTSRKHYSSYTWCGKIPPPPLSL